MEYLILLAIVLLALVAWLQTQGEDADPRELSNEHVRVVWFNAKATHYPHQLDDGSVRYYRTGYDPAMDV